MHAIIYACLIVVIFNILDGLETTEKWISECYEEMKENRETLLK